MNKSINKLLTTSEMAVINAIHNPQITEALKSFGFQKEALSKGQLLIEKAQKLHLEHQDTEEEKAIQELRSSFLKHTKLARIIFISDENAWIQLGLNGARKQSKNGWISEANNFYTAILNDKNYTLAFTKFNVKSGQIIDILETLSQLESDLIQNGSHQEDTFHRDAAVDELQDWMSGFFDTARVALKQKPHQLKALGLETYGE